MDHRHSKFEQNQSRIQQQMLKFPKTGEIMLFKIII